MANIYRHDSSLSKITSCLSNDRGEKFGWKKLAGKNSLARVRVSTWRVNSLNLVQLWIQRKTREELPPALIRNYFPTGPPNFCWKKSPLFQVGRCCALATRSPMRKSSFASRAFESQSNGNEISSCGV